MTLKPVENGIANPFGKPGAMVTGAPASGANVPVFAPATGLRNAGLSNEMVYGAVDVNESNPIIARSPVIDAACAFGVRASSRAPQDKRDKTRFKAFIRVYLFCSYFCSVGLPPTARICTQVANVRKLLKRHTNPFTTATYTNRRNSIAVPWMHSCAMFCVA